MIDSLNTPTPSQPAPPDDDEPADDEIDEILEVDAVVEFEHQKRLWMSAAWPYANMELPDPETVPKSVRTAAERCRMAALDRVARLLRSDVVDDAGGR